MSLDANNICTVILAGGRGSRMQGADKGLLPWRDRPLIEHVMDALDVDKSCLIISANRHLERYQQYGYPVVSDVIGDFQGPLVGILSAMRQTQRPYLLCVPCDSPQPPAHLLTRLISCLQQQQRQLALCHDGERVQPLFSLLSCSLAPQLETYLRSGRRKVQEFFSDNDAAVCDFSDQAHRFHNFNRPEDMP